MKRISKITALICCIALAAAMFPIPASARTQTGESVNILEQGGVTVGEALYRGTSSDTVAAVADGMLYPASPWAGSGPNPYAWTNYNATQEGIPYASLGFGWSQIAPGNFTPKWVTGVTIWYFVDSYSASLPESVSFNTTWHSEADKEYGEICPVNPTMNLVRQTQLTDTCIECVYEPADGPFPSLGLEIMFTNQNIVRESGKLACTGVYEVAVYGYDLEPSQEIELPVGEWNSVFAGIYAGSAEFDHGKEPDNARDGDPNTLWHTDWDGCSDEERYIEAYLGKRAPISGFRYYAREGNKDGDSNGRVADYEIWVSNGGPEFCVASGHWDNSGGWKEVTFDTVDAITVRLVGVTTYGNSTPNKYMSAAEIQVLGGWWN